MKLTTLTNPVLVTNPTSEGLPHGPMWRRREKLRIGKPRERVLSSELWERNQSGRKWTLDDGSYVRDREATYLALYSGTGPGRDCYLTLHRFLVRAV